MPTIIDLNAEAEKLTTLHGMTPQATPARRKGGMARLGSYRDGILLLGTSAGTGRGHWETHPEDELIHILDGMRTLEIVCDDGPPQSFELRAGMIAVIPQGAWHRFHSLDLAIVLSAVIPGPHVDLDVPDPRPHVRTSSMERRFASRPPSIIDLNAELAKLTLFRGRTPRSTMADRKGSSARLASYRDGTLSITKFAGKGHWECHLAGDELIHILDGTATLEMVGEDGSQSFALRAGMIAVNPRGAWHRFSSADGVTLLAVTPSPSEVIDLDVDDPRQVERKPA
jgi:mannose-6-phosphate isomerase-like protein (cupin superfamily)